MDNTLIKKLQLEMIALTTKIDNLDSFLHSKRSNNISNTQDALLKIQSSAMKTYRDCLFERIFDLIEEKSKKK